MESFLWKKLPLCGLVLLQVSLAVRGEDCDLDIKCSLLSHPKYTTLAFSTATASVQCQRDLFPTSSTEQRVESIAWLHSTATGLPAPLDVDSDPKLEVEGFNLNLMNVTDAYEGVYYCQARYKDGTVSPIRATGCVFVSGRAYYTHCPETVEDGENCEAATQLIGNVGEDIEFDSRVEFRHGGECNAVQTVRLMFLNKILDDESQERMFVCSNLGSLGTVRTCPNKTRVVVSYLGEKGKYNIRLSLKGITLADSGNYQAMVEVDEYVGGRRKSILKNFHVTVEDNSAVSSEEESDCSRGADTVLLLAGEVLSNGTELNVTAGEIGESLQALLCVTIDGGQKLSPQFYGPNLNPVSTALSTNSLYMTMGEQVARLNYNSGTSAVMSDEAVSPEPLKSGVYCCSVTKEMHYSSCVNIVN